MSTTPVNVQVPNAPEAPVVADFVEHAIRVAYVNRAHLKALPEEKWAEAGVYVLLTDDGSGDVYVGKAVHLRKRLQEHSRRPKLPWSRAIAMKRDTTHGFNSAEIGYLEGRLAAEVAAVSGLTVVEGKRDSDATLPPHMMLSLDALLASMLAAIRLAGIDISKEVTDADDSRAGVRGSRRKPRTIPGTVADLVSTGLLPAGEKLFLRQGSVEADATVTADGAIVVENVAYPTPSMAAKVALDGKSSNGWAAWHVGSIEGPTLDALRSKWLKQQEIPDD